jgi:phage gp36-like protein
MAYSKVEEVRTVLIGRREEDRNETPDELDDDQIEYAITSADAQINGVIRRRYELPLVEPYPPLIHMLSVDIAAYLCHLVFLMTTPLNAEAPAARRYDRARRLLDDLRSRRIDIESTEIVNSGEGLESIFNDYDMPLFPSQHIFGPDYPEGTFPTFDPIYG